MIDEVEKALSGAAGGGQADSGVSARLFGTLLSWLNDHQSDVFVVCTANDVSKLPPEFSLAERFDGIFFLDLPGRRRKTSSGDSTSRSLSSTRCNACRTTSNGQEPRSKAAAGWRLSWTSP